MNHEIFLTLTYLLLIFFPVIENLDLTWWEEIKPPIEQKPKNIFFYVCYENETNHVKKYDVCRI